MEWALSNIIMGIIELAYHPMDIISAPTPLAPGRPCCKIFEHSKHVNHVST